MVKQVINVGANANDGTGDDLRTAMQKINTNFTELFGTTAEANDLVEDGTPQLGGNLDIQNYIITTNTTNGTISIQPNGSGAVLLKNIRITDNVISSDDSTNITINDSLIVTGSVSTPTLYTNVIQSDDSSVVQINDGVTVSGTLKSNSVITNSLSSDDSSAIEIAEDLLVSGTVSAESVRTNSLYSEAIQIVDNNISTRRSNDDLVLSPSGTGSVNLRGAKITNLGTPTANGDAATKQYVDGVAFGGVASTSITLVGDDSTGTAISLGESFKIAGTSNITTAVSGDTLTITGIITGDFAFSGNTLSTTSSNADIELDPAGTGNLILKSGNFLPAADNSQYLGSASKRWHTLYVGPGSINIDGVILSASGGKLNMGADIEVNAISSADSSAIQINDGVNISGDTHLHGSLTVTGDLITLGRTTAPGAGSIGMSGTRILGSLELTNPNGSSTMAMGMSFAGASGGEGQMIFEGNNASGYALVPSNNNQYTLGRPEVAGPGSGAYWKNLYVYNVNFPDSTEQTTAARITVVGDDSTGVTLNAGETIKIAGAGGVTTAVSGDTLTITGLSQSTTMTFVGDDSTGVTLNSGETIKIAGSGGITTSVSGDTLTIDATLTGGSLANLSVTGQTISGTTTNGDINITPNGTGDINLTVGGQVKITDGTNDYNDVFNVANTQARYGYGLSSMTYKVFDLSLNNQNRIYANSLAGHIVLSGTDLDNNSGQLGWRGAHVDLITDLDGNQLVEKAIVAADPSSKGSNRNNNSGGEIRTYSLGPVALGVQNIIRNTATPTAAALSETTGISSFTAFDHNFDSFGHGAITVQEFSGVSTGVNLASNSGTTNITNLVGYRATGNYVTNGTGNVTNYYAFYAHDNSEATNNYGIYVENDSYENYLGGLVVKNSTIAANRSNESLYLSTSGTGKVIVNDSLQVINTLTATTIITNDISSADSSAIQINDSVNISGTLTSATIVNNTISTNEIASADSSAIQINDSVNISGTLTSATIVNNTISTNEIASADSSAIQINDGVNISGTLNAKTIVTNDLISQDSSVINVLDGLNVSGTLTTTSINSSSAVSAEHLTLTGLLTLGKRTVAQLILLTPDTGTVAYCTDETGGAQPVFYDGTNWRRMTDRITIS